MASSQGLCAQTVTGAHSTIATANKARCCHLLFRNKVIVDLPVRLLIGIHTCIAPFEGVLQVRIP